MKYNEPDIYRGDFFQSPSQTSKIINQINNSIETDEFIFKLKSQYKNLNYFGVNIFKEYKNELSNEILADFLLFVDKQYLSINYLDQILDSNEMLFFYANMTYEILFVDFLSKILDPIIKNNVNLILLPESSIKIIITNKIREILNILSKIEKNKKTDADVIKWNFAFDLFDTDIDMFFENFLIPVLQSNYNGKD